MYVVRELSHREAFGFDLSERTKRCREIAGTFAMPLANVAHARAPHMFFTLSDDDELDEVDRLNVLLWSPLLFVSPGDTLLWTICCCCCCCCCIAKSSCS